MARVTGVRQRDLVKTRPTGQRAAGYRAGTRYPIVGPREHRGSVRFQSYGPVDLPLAQPVAHRYSAPTNLQFRALNST